MKIDWNSPINWAGAVFAASSALFVLHKIGQFFNLSTADWAAWVQAVGSIAAIAVALRISRKTAEDQVKKEREYPLRNLRVIAKRAEHFIDRVPNTNSLYSEAEINAFLGRLDRRASNDVEQALRDFALPSLQDDRAIEAVFEMRAAMNLYCDLIAGIVAQDSLSDAQDAVIENLLVFEETQNRFALAMSRLKIALDSAGIE